MIHFLYKKILPTAAMTLTSMVCYSMEPVVTDSTVTPAATTDVPVTPVTPSDSATANQVFIQDLQYLTTELDNIIAMTGTGCGWCASTTQKLAVETSNLLVQIGTVVIPTAITDTATLLVEIQKITEEAQTLIALFNQIGSTVKKTAPALSAYSQATSSKAKAAAKPQAQVRLIKLNTALHAINNQLKSAPATSVPAGKL